MHPTTPLSLALAILRIPLGFVFLAHGWQKYAEYTLEGTTGAFTEMGIPLPELAAPVVATLEVVGGIALILGLGTRVFGALLFIDMAGALALVHGGSGVFVADNGYELVLALGAGALALALTGAGAFSLDRALFGRGNGALARALYPAPRAEARTTAGTDRVTVA